MAAESPHRLSCDGAVRGVALSDEPENRTDPGAILGAGLTSRRGRQPVTGDVLPKVASGLGAAAENRPSAPVSGVGRKRDVGAEAGLILWGGGIMRDGSDYRWRVQHRSSMADGPARDGRCAEGPLNPGRLDLAEAARVQRSFLPAGSIGSDEFEVAWHYRPIGAIGGDLLDVVHLSDNRLLLFIADAAGHGVQAALIAAAAKAILHAYRNRVSTLGPARLLARLNTHLEGLLDGTFITAAACLLDPRSGLMRYALAGHPPVLVADRSGVTPLARGGLPLGIQGDSGYLEGQIDLLPDALVLLYTDGVTEARSVDGREFGASSLIEALCAAWPSDVAGVLRSILAEVDGFRRAGPWLTTSRSWPPVTWEPRAVQPDGHSDRGADEEAVRFRSPRPSPTSRTILPALVRGPACRSSSSARSGARSRRRYRSR